MMPQRLPAGLSDKMAVDQSFPRRALESRTPVEVAPCNYKVLAKLALSTDRAVPVQCAGDRAHGVRYLSSQPGASETCGETRLRGCG